MRSAVDSALGQDIARSRFELIVVKDFSDSEIDSFLDDEGVTRILCSEGPLSLKVAEGIRASRGTVLFFLDDDDLFEPEKLRTVLSEFTANPELGFYHNQQTYIGPGGDVIHPNQVTFFGQRVSGRARRVLLAPNSTARDLRRLAFTYPDFNLSSHATRRNLAVRFFPYLSRVHYSVDRLLFFAALVSSYSLLVDSRVLTRYRIHAANTSLAGDSSPNARRAQLLGAIRRQAESDLLIREMVLESGNAAILGEVDGRIVVDRLTSIYRDLEQGRFDSIRALAAGIRLWRTSAIRENVPSMTGATLFSLWPRLARAVYDRQLSIRY